MYHMLQECLAVKVMSHLGGLLLEVYEYIYPVQPLVYIGKVRLSPGRDTDEVMTKKRPSLLEEEEIEVVSESNIDNSSELLLNNK